MRVTFLAITALSAIGVAMPFQTARAQETAIVAPIEYVAPSVEDLTLLRKAVAAVQKRPITITSDIKVKASGSGVLMTINETVKVSGVFPDRFRADVTLLDEDGKTAAARFQVIADGKTVTTFRPGTKQYATQTVGAFHKDFAMPVIGVVCGLIASGDPWLNEDMPIDTDTVAVFLDALKSTGMILESGAGVGGQRVFLMRSATTDTNGFRVVMTTDPVTEGFTAMEMSGKQGDWKFAITETVRSMAKLPSFAAPVFDPPADAKKVAKLSIWPF